MHFYLFLYMNLQRFSRFMAGLTREQKYVFYGSALISLSVFMPWYSDLDAFKTGDTFFGLTGPLYLIGVLLLIGGTTCLFTLTSRRVRDRMESIFSHLGDLYLIVAGFSIFLLILANSVYFHPKFGVNIALKDSRFGMTMAIVGAISMSVGGYFIRRRRAYRHEYNAEESGHLEPLIRMSETPDVPDVTMPPSAPIVSSTPSPSVSSSSSFPYIPRREHGEVAHRPSDAYGGGRAQDPEVHAEVRHEAFSPEPSYERDQTLEEVIESSSNRQEPLL